MKPLPLQAGVEELAHAYLGHFAERPLDLALLTASDFQEALDWCDSVGQPDEGSFEAVTEPLVLRLHATLEEEGDGGEVFQFIAFAPHPEGALALHGSLQRFHDRAANKTSTITGDILRSYGPICDECGYRHFENQECRAFLESGGHLAAYLVMLNQDPHDVAIVVGPEDEAEILELAAQVGAEPSFLGPVGTCVLFNIHLARDDSTRSNPHFACQGEETDWMEPLVDLLRNQG
jgi:hypothetical protein